MKMTFISPPHLVLNSKAWCNLSFSPGSELNLCLPQSGITMILNINKSVHILHLGVMS